MVLGVYWYFAFPEDLYTYDYFKFSKGYGGHADNPAELITKVNVTNADTIIEELRALVDQYEGAFIFIYRMGNFLQIGTGGYHMYDFDFELALKIEQILKGNDVQLSSGNSFKVAELIKLSNVKTQKSSYPTKKYFSMASSAPHKYNAETSNIRFDCNVDVHMKDVFLEEVKLSVSSADINVVFYSQKEFEGRYNLMLFFTNGRQGLGLKPKQRVDVEVFERTMDVLIQKYAVQIGHVGGWDYYPIGERIVLRMVDEEFILG